MFVGLPFVVGLDSRRPSVLRCSLAFRLSAVPPATGRRLADTFLWVCWPSGLLPLQAIGAHYRRLGLISLGWPLFAGRRSHLNPAVVAHNLPTGHVVTAHVVIFVDNKTHHMKHVGWVGEWVAGT